jgi:receptor protein-tyrosine kinase
LVAAPSPAVVAVSAVDAHTDGPLVARVTANLAISLSSAEHSVCVVDATLGGGDLAALLDVPPSPGLTEILLHQEGEALPLLQNHGVAVLPAGRTPQRSRELYASPHFASILASLRERFDYVLIAAPSASTPDGNEVALAADGVAVLLTDCRTTHAAVQEVVSRARQLGVTIFGAVAAPRPKRPTRGLRQGRRSASEALDADGTGAVAWEPPRDPGSESLEPAVTPAPGMPVDR